MCQYNPIICLIETAFTIDGEAISGATAVLFASSFDIFELRRLAIFEFTKAFENAELVLLSFKLAN